MKLSVVRVSDAQRRAARAAQPVAELGTRHAFGSSSGRIPPSRFLPVPVMRLSAIDWRALMDPATLKQRLSRAPTAVWVGVALVPPLVAGALLLVARQAEHLALAHEQAARTELAALRAKAATAPAANASPFATRLPLTQSSARAVTHLREAAESQSVLVTAISTAHQAPTASTLGRMSLDVNLRGSYAAIKTVLAELLTRDAQQAVLQQISLRRAPGAAPNAAGGFAPMNTMNTARPMGAPAGGDLEARVVATWLSRPLADQPSPAAIVAVPTAPAAIASSASSASSPAIAASSTAKSASASSASSAPGAGSPTGSGLAASAPAATVRSPAPSASSASAPKPRR